MSIDFKCLMCGSEVLAEDELAGQVISCPSCGRNCKVPTPIGGKLTEKRLTPPAKEANKTGESAGTFKPKPSASREINSFSMPAQVRTPNVMRDGKYLVVPLEANMFPKRCIKTNQTVEETDFRITLDMFRSQIRVPNTARETATEVGSTLLFGAAGGGIADIANKVRLDFKIGLSNELQELSHKRKKWGLILIIAAPILGILCGMASVFIMQQMNKTPSFGVMVVALCIGMSPMIVGIILFGMSSASLLSVLGSDGTYVWLNGAGEKFLESLPESTQRWQPRKLFGRS